MGKEKFIAFTEALAEIYNKVEECYVTINDFQKEIGFKKSDQFEINNLVYIIGNDILEERNLFTFYERHKFKFKKKLEHDFLLYIKMQNTVYMMHNKASSLGFLNKIWDKISVVDCKDATYENEKLRCLNADHIFLIYSLNKSNMRVVQMFDDENFKRKITVINESDLKDITINNMPINCLANFDAEIITHSAKRDFMETTQLFKKFMMLFKIIFHSKISQLRKINVFAIVREHSINFEIIKF